MTKAFLPPTHREGLRFRNHPKPEILNPNICTPCIFPLGKVFGTSAACAFESLCKPPLGGGEPRVLGDAGRRRVYHF